MPLARLSEATGLLMSEVEVSVVAMAVGVSLGLPVSQQKVTHMIRTFNSD